MPPSSYSATATVWIPTACVHYGHSRPISSPRSSGEPRQTTGPASAHSPPPTPQFASNRDSLTKPDSCLWPGATLGDCLTRVRSGACPANACGMGNLQTSFLCGSAPACRRAGSTEALQLVSSSSFTSRAYLAASLTFGFGFDCVAARKPGAAPHA